MPCSAKRASLSREGGTPRAKFWAFLFFFENRLPGALGGAKRTGKPPSGFPENRCTAFFQRIWKCAFSFSENPAAILRVLLFALNSFALVFRTIFAFLHFICFPFCSVLFSACGKEGERLCSIWAFSAWDGGRSWDGCVFICTTR